MAADAEKQKAAAGNAKFKFSFWAADCGTDSIKPAGKTSYWHSSDDVTGQYTVTAVGVLTGGDNWNCTAE
jgi:hypothetical protein